MVVIWLHHWWISKLTDTTASQHMYCFWPPIRSSWQSSMTMTNKQKVNVIQHFNGETFKDNISIKNINALKLCCSCWWNTFGFLRLKGEHAKKKIVFTHIFYFHPQYWKCLWAGGGGWKITPICRALMLTLTITWSNLDYRNFLHT